MSEQTLINDLTGIIEKMRLIRESTLRYYPKNDPLLLKEIIRAEDMLLVSEFTNRYENHSSSHDRLLNLYGQAIEKKSINMAALKATFTNILPTLIENIDARYGDEEVHRLNGYLETNNGSEMALELFLAKAQEIIETINSLA